MWPIGLAATIGAIATVGWAPSSHWYISLASFAGLILLIACAARAWKAGITGLSFALGLQSVGHRWLMPALNYATDGHTVLSTFAFAAYVGYICLFTAIPCALWHAIFGCRRPTAGSATVFASLMTLGEWARSIPFNGFTSLSLGFALVDTWLAPLATIGGVYAVSWAGYLIAGLAAVAIRGRTQVRGILKGAILPVSVVGVLAVAGRWPWTVPDGAPLRFHVVQTNTSLSLENTSPQAAARTTALIGIVTALDAASIVLLPESALKQTLSQFPLGSLAGLQAYSTALGVNVFAGIGDPALSGVADTNTLLQVRPDGKLVQYDKVRLMPIGEYLPWPVRWLRGALTPVLIELTPGSAVQQPFSVAGVFAGAVICHEELTSDVSRRWAHLAGLVLNPTNMQWFRGSAAAPLTLQIARMRALEIGRPFLRAANTGLSAHIDEHGRVVQSLGGDIAGVISGEVQPMKGLTPFAIAGEWPVVALLLIQVAVAARQRRRPIPRIPPDGAGRG